MKRIFNIILFALFGKSFAQAKGNKTFEFTYEGQTLKYVVADGNEAMVSNEKSAKISGDVKIPESVTFEGKKYRVTTIGKYAFASCKGLTSVTIPNSVTTIGESAFGYCDGLTSVTIPNSVTEIGEYAFADCENLKSINVAKDNSHYCSENGVLFDISKKRLIQYPCGIKGKYVIPNSVTTIDGWAFAGCTGLTSVTIPNSVTTIEEYAFARCAGLSSVTIPNSVETIEVGAFCGENLKSINVAKDNSHYCSENGVLFDITKKRLIQYPCGIKGKYVIPNSVTTIDEWAFARCAGLSSVTIPNSVTTIDGWAFAGCTGLTSVTILNSVTTIGMSAFYGCKGLTNVTIGNSVTTIGEYVFAECTGLTSVTIPNSVTTIDEKAFSDCTGLTILTIENATPPEVRGGAFEGISENITIYVPAESVEKYKAAEGWSKYADKIKAIEK